MLYELYKPYELFQSRHNFCSPFGHDNRILKVGRKTLILGDIGPLVRCETYGETADIDHRFECDRHPLPKREIRNAPVEIIRNLWFLVELATDAVPDQGTHENPSRFTLFSTALA